MALLRGRATEGGEPRGERHTGLTWGPVAMLAGGVRIVADVLLVARLEAGLVARPVVGVVPGASEVAVDGAWLGAAGGLGWRF